MLSDMTYNVTWLQMNWHLEELQKVSYYSQMAVCWELGGGFVVCRILTRLKHNWQLMIVIQGIIWGKNDVHDVLYTATPLHKLGTVSENSEIS